VRSVKYFASVLLSAGTFLRFGKRITRALTPPSCSCFSVTTSPGFLLRYPLLLKAPGSILLPSFPFLHVWHRAKTVFKVRFSVLILVLAVCFDGRGFVCIASGIFRAVSHDALSHEEDAVPCPVFSVSLLSLYCVNRWRRDVARVFLRPSRPDPSKTQSGILSGSQVGAPPSLLLVSKWFRGNAVSFFLFWSPLFHSGSNVLLFPTNAPGLLFSDSPGFRKFRSPFFPGLPSRSKANGEGVVHVRYA